MIDPARARAELQQLAKESSDRIALATRGYQQADRKATEAGKAVTDRWTKIVNALQRRANDRDAARGEPGNQARGVMNIGEDVEDEHLDEFDRLVLEEEARQAAETARRAAEDDRAAGFLDRAAGPAERAQEQPMPYPPQAPVHRPAPPPAGRRPRRPVQDDDEDFGDQSWLH